MRIPKNPHAWALAIAATVALGGCRVTGASGRGPARLDRVPSSQDATPRPPEAPPPEAAPTPGDEPEGALVDGFTMEEVVAEALRANPSIRAAFADAAAARERPAQERWLDDPQAVYAPMIEHVETREGPMQYSLSIQQAVPFPTKLSARGKVAERAARVGEQRYLETVDRVMEEAKVAVLELAFIHEAIRITGETLTLLRNMESVARDKYTVGETPQWDLLKAQSELAEVEDDVLALEDERRSAEARIRAILDRRPGTPVGRPAPAPPVEALPDLEALYEIALRTRPEIAAASEAIERDSTDLGLREQGYVPDLHIGAQFTKIGGGPDAWGLTLGFSVPIWVPRIRASVREGERKVDASRARLRATTSRTIFEVKDNHTRWQTATRRARLLRETLIPQAEQAYRAAESGYQAGEVDFLDYLDGQRTLLDRQLDLERARVEAGRRRAALERAVGQEF